MIQYENRPLTSDALVIRDNKVVLIKRVNEPFKDYWAIPGGFVELGETTKECALRELKEETGLTGRILKIVGVYDSPSRDPRHTVCITYLVSVDSLDDIESGDDSREVGVFPLGNLPELAFDHKIMIENSLRLFKK